MLHIAGHNKFPLRSSSRLSSPFIPNLTQFLLSSFLPCFFFFFLTKFISPFLLLFSIFLYISIFKNVIFLLIYTFFSSFFTSFSHLFICYILICWFMRKYTYICWIHTDVINKDARRKTSITIIYLPLTLLQGFERVVQGLHVRGSWRSNVNGNILTPLLWPPHCVFLVLLILGSTPSGFPRAPSVGCGFPFHIWSLAVWNSTGNCFLDSNSTELNNNSTPTRSPTGSLKSNV